MNKKIVLLIYCSTLLALAGCEQKESVQEFQQENEIVQQESLNENSEVKEEAVAVYVYKIDTHSGERITEVKECEELNEAVVWELLKDVEIVPKESSVLAFEEKGNRLELDVDVAFGDWLRSFGTTGEREIVSCVVNTYLDAYKAEEIKLTEEGQVLCTGHAEYAEYLRKFE